MCLTGTSREMILASQLRHHRLAISLGGGHVKTAENKIVLLKEFAMAMTRDQMLQIVDDLYAASGVGDFDTAETMLTDDLVITEADTLPMAGLYRGKTALRELYGKVMGMMDVAALNRVETTTGIDHAVTILSFEFADPALAPAHLCELFRFRDGKVCEILPYYFDPGPIVAACKAKAAAKQA
jgi:SnoaL-like domain